MRPEDWQEIRHLLLLCVLNQVDDWAAIIKVINFVCHQLEQNSIQLLVLIDQKYQFYPVHSELYIESFSDLLPLNDYHHLIHEMQQKSFEAAVVLTPPARSPFSLAYLCYLAKIPIRLGQSMEFGGGVLSHCVSPPLEPVTIADYQLHLLKSAGFPGLASQPAIAA